MAFPSKDVRNYSQDECQAACVLRYLSLVLLLIRGDRAFGNKGPNKAATFYNLIPA
jgi:hypothetical protein